MQTCPRQASLPVQGGSQPVWLQKPARQVSLVGHGVPAAQACAVLGTHTWARQTCTDGHGGAHETSAQKPCAQVRGLAQSVASAQVMGEHLPAWQVSPVPQAGGEHCENQRRS